MVVYCVYDGGYYMCVCPTYFDALSNIRKYIALDKQYEEMPEEHHYYVQAFDIVGQKVYSV